MDNFSVTLPAVETALFPSNKLSCFSTRLYKTIDVKEFHMGLSEIHISCKLKTLSEADCTFKVHLDEVGNLNSIIKIPYKRYESVTSVLRQINNAFKANKTTKHYRFIGSKDSAGRKTIIFERTDKPLFIVAPVKFTFSARMAQVLGAPRKTIEATEFRHYGPLLKKKFDKPMLMYVYSSLVEPQIVGNTVSQLLKIVRMNYDENDVLNVSCIYDRVSYMPLIESDVSTINISLRTVDGEKFPLATGSLALNLNFSKVIV